jgi:hypothetical protein
MVGVADGEPVQVIESEFFQGAGAFFIYLDNFNIG